VTNNLDALPDRHSTSTSKIGTCPLWGAIVIICPDASHDWPTRNLCLAVAQQLLGFARQRRWIRYARTHLVTMFPNLHGQSGLRQAAAGPGAG